MKLVRSIRQLPAVLWALLCVGLLAPSGIWIAEDHTVWPWDQAWYGEVSADLWFWMGHSLRRWVGELADGLSLKPPGVVWLGQLFVPLRHIFGSVEISLLVSILATQFVLLAILFRIGRRLCSGSSLAAAAGVTLAAGTSLFAGLSHQFFVEPLQAAAVAWVYYVAVEAPGWTSLRIAAQLALAMVVGVLAKADTPLYCVLPCLYAAGLICRKKPPRAEISACWKSLAFRAQAVLLVLLTGAAALWYYRNMRAVWQHARDSSAGAVALDYGSRDSWLHKLVQWWGLLNDSFLSPYLGWVFLAALAGAGLFGMLRLRQRREKVRIEPVAILSALQILLLLSVLSTTIVLEPRFLYAILPSIAIVFMQLCAFLPARFLAVAVVACGAQWAAVNAESLAIVGRLGHQSQWLVTPEFDRSHYDDLTRVVRLTSDAPDRYDIVAVECSWMNANAAAFFAAKNRLRTGVRSYYTSLGYAESDFGAAMRRIGEFRPRYVITLAEPFQAGLPGFLNVVSLPVLRDLRSDDRFSQVPFASHSGVLVFRFKNGFPAGTAAGSAP
ncbi:MAG: hypothetical protein ABSH00_19555 [Bryobacteraceae bacterium]|jgi:hypothetical protein